MTDRPHGTNARYIAGCHCELCRRAHADYMARYRNRQTGVTTEASELTHCPTCHAPAYQRPNGTLQFAGSQPGHRNGFTRDAEGREVPA